MSASAAPGSGLIVFSREVGGDHELFSIRADGSGVTRLTNDNLHEAEPVWSPDRRRIAAAGAGELRVRSVSGELLRRIEAPADGVVSEPRWSPGGRLIAFLVERCQSEDNPDPAPFCADLWVVRPDGSRRRRLVDANVSTNDLVAGYAWSPRGRSIAYEPFQGRGLVVVDVATGRARTLRATRGSSDPAWSRRGWIAFARQRGPFTGSDLYVIRPDGSGLRRVARTRSAMRPALSPDGRRIAFLDFDSTPNRNRWHVGVIRADGSGRRRIGEASAEWTLAWSPDGTRVLWENEPGRLVVGRADGRGRPQVVARGTGADW